MSRIRFHKVIDELPSVLTPDSVYFVKRGLGYDTYVTGVQPLEVGEDSEVVAVSHNNPLLLHTAGNSEEYAISQLGLTNVVGDIQGMLEAINTGEWDGRWQSSWDGLLDGRLSKVDKEEGKSLISIDEIDRLSKIEDEATRNSPDDFLLNRENHTGTIEPSVVNGLNDLLGNLVTREEGRSLAFDDDISKLQLLSPDEFVMERSNHTGVQSIDTIIDLSYELESLTTEIETLNTTMGDITTILDEILGETP